jgi:hypothetical protein
MSLIHLRRNFAGDADAPYRFDNGGTERLRGRVGEVRVLGPTHDGYVAYGVCIPSAMTMTELIGVALFDENLDQKVFDDCVMYGETLAAESNGEFVLCFDEPVKFYERMRKQPSV